jgi:hypothetical protein
LHQQRQAERAATMEGVTAHLPVTARLQTSSVTKWHKVQHVKVVEGKN